MDGCLLADKLKHAAVEVFAQHLVALLLLHRREERLVGQQRARHIVLTEEGAQDGFLFKRRLAFPVTLQQLLNVLIVHILRFLSFSV